ncbi:MAG: efflux RND transporter periplasmic adaptor subunit [Bacteroidales bacterium]|nr:efflux RND transporter periplasmic adaptor subunit [Bacteroidales bacterium]
MNGIKFVLLIGSLAWIISCGVDKSGTSAETEIKHEIPPSLQPEDNNAIIIQLSEAEQKDLDIETISLSSDLIQYALSAPGVVFPAPAHSSIISTPIDGQISRINKYDGSWVRKGEELFQIQSLEFGNLVSEYLQAHAEEHYQESRLNRLRQLVEETISSTSELERVISEYERSSASARASYSRLKAIGVTEKEIESITESEKIDPVLKVYSPIDGYVEKIFVELGQSVSALETLSRVLDTREVLIKAYLSPDDARLIHTGDSVYVSKRDNRQPILSATITSINPGLDEDNRSVVANILVSTQSGWPKPGENVRLDIITSSQKEIFAVPLTALSYDGNQAIVFIKKSPGRYEKRNISVSDIRDKYVFVNQGVSNGEEIAVSNIFSLKALSRFNIISEE